MNLRTQKFLLAGMTLFSLCITLQADDSELCRPVAWRQQSNPAFSERENLSFVVHWGLVKAGKAVLAVNGMESLSGRSAYHLSMDIKAAGLTGSLHPYHDRTDSWLDRDSLTTVRYVKQVRESHYQEDETVDLDQVCQFFMRQENRLDKKEITDKHGSMPPYPLDTYGALFYLRTLPLAVGQHYDLELFTGDKILSVSAVVKKKERLKVGAGRFDCFLVEPRLRDATSSGGKVKQIQWWFSSDERHLPIKIRMEVAVGHIVAELAKIN